MLLLLISCVLVSGGSKMSRWFTNTCLYSKLEVGQQFKSTRNMSQHEFHQTKETVCNLWSFVQALCGVQNLHLLSKYITYFALRHSTHSRYWSQLMPEKNQILVTRSFGSVRIQISGFRSLNNTVFASEDHTSLFL